ARRALRGETAAEEFTMLLPDGAHRIHITAAPVRDDGGAVIAAVLVGRDVTELHEAVAERARIEGAVKTARTVAHEINNQLGVLLVYTDLLGIQAAERAQPLEGLPEIGESVQA